MRRRRRNFARAVIGVLAALAMLASAFGALGRITAHAASLASVVDHERIYPRGGGAGLAVQIEASARHHIDWNWRVSHRVVEPASVRVGPGGAHTFTYQATVTPTRQDIVQVSGTVSVTNGTDAPTTLESVEVTVGEDGQPFPLRLLANRSIAAGQSRSIGFEYFVTVGGPGSTYDADRFLNRSVITAAVTSVDAAQPTQTRMTLDTRDIRTTRSDVAATLDTFDEFAGPVRLDTDEYPAAENWTGHAWVFTYPATRAVTERGDVFARDDSPLLHTAASGPGVFPSWATLTPSGGDVPPGWHDGQNPNELKDDAVAILTTYDLLQLSVAEVNGAYRRDFAWSATKTETGGLGRDEHGRSPVQYVTPGSGVPFEFQLEVRAAQSEPTPLVLTGTLEVANGAPLARSLESLVLLVDGVRFDDALINPPSTIAPGGNAKIDFRIELEAGDLGIDDNGYVIDVYTGIRHVTAEVAFGRLAPDSAGQLDLAEVRPSGSNPSAVVAETLKIANGFTDGFADPHAFATRYGEHVKLDALDPGAFSVGGITPWNGDAWVFRYPVRLGEHLTGQGVSAMFASIAWITPTTADQAVSANEIVRVSSGQPLKLSGEVHLDANRTATGTIAVVNYNRKDVALTTYGIGAVLAARGDAIPVGLKLLTIDGVPAAATDIATTGGSELIVPGRYGGHAGQIVLGIEVDLAAVNPTDVTELTANVTWEPTLGTPGFAAGAIALQRSDSSENR